MHYQGGAGYHAERAFRTNKKLQQIRPHRLAGAVATEFNKFAVRQHHRESAHDIFDLAVAVGVLTGAATGQPSADRGEVE